MLRVDGKWCAFPGLQHEATHVRIKGVTDGPLRIAGVLELGHGSSCFRLLAGRKAKDKFRSHDPLRHPPHLPEELIPVRLAHGGDIQMKRSPGAKEYSEQAAPQNVKCAAALGLADPPIFSIRRSRIGAVGGGATGERNRNDQQ